MTDAGASGKRWRFRMSRVLPVAVRQQRVVFDVVCPRCTAPMPVDAEAVARGKAVLISIDPCAACGYDPPIEYWDAARAEARRLLRGEA